MQKCKHQIPFKCKMYCTAYHDAQPEGEKKWTQFPPCKNEYCPIEHPELLERVMLKTEVKQK